MYFQIAIDGMARILCMSELIDKDPAKLSSSTHGGRSSTARAEHHTHPRSSQSKDRRSTPRHQTEPGGYGSCVQPSPVPADPGGGGLIDRSPVHCPVSPALEADVRDIRRLLKTYVTRLETKDAAARAAKEWRIVARVLDRLFFFCYIGTIVVSMFTIFPGDISATYSTDPPADEPTTTLAPDAEYDPDYTRWRHRDVTGSSSVTFINRSTWRLISTLSHSLSDTRIWVLCFLFHSWLMPKIDCTRFPVTIPSCQLDDLSPLPPRAL